MSLESFYNQIIVEHGRSPRNFRKMDDATLESCGENPLCGETVTIYLKIADDTIENTAFHGEGCAIAMASASLMTELLKGKTVADAQSMFEGFQSLVASGARVEWAYEDSDENSVEEWECAAGFEPPEWENLVLLWTGAREYPMRIKCAELPWQTLKAALDGRTESISTDPWADRP